LILLEQLFENSHRLTLQPAAQYCSNKAA
jgi:hypothetical protein